MYSEEIKHLSQFSDVNTCKNDIRNAYFENRSCLNNLLDFLNQEIVIIPSNYFTYPEGPGHILEDGYLDYDYDDGELNERIIDATCNISGEDEYHISVLDNYISIVSDGKKCIFTNKDMEEGVIIGSVFWVENFNELLEKFGNKNLKRISKAIVHPFITETVEYDQTLEEHRLVGDFFVSMEICYPEIVFKYTIDSYMENICLDVYNKLLKVNLNGLVDKYLPKYQKCDGYGTKGEQGSSIKPCKCGRLRAMCYLDL